MRELINRQLDRLAHASFKVGQRSVLPFHFWSAVGLVLGVVITLNLTTHRRVMLLLVAVNLFCAFVYALLVKVVTGRERHTHYHYEIAIAAVTIVALRSLGQTVVPYLDAMVVGKGVLLAIGRLGCFMAGCCHGRSCHIGVCYRHEHLRYYAGIRLFPVQLFETVIASGLVVLCAYLLLSDAPHGTTLGTYVIGYGAARFFIELLRGDPQRPYLRGYSEAQWTSVSLMSLVVWLEYFAVLPLHSAHVIVVAGVFTAMLSIAVMRRFRQTTHGLFARIVNP